MLIWHFIYFIGDQVHYIQSEQSMVEGVFVSDSVLYPGFFYIRLEELVLGLYPSL